MSISIIIPIYDEEKVIADCLMSLAQQVVTPLEIIVVDDGSNDRSKSKVQSVKQMCKMQNLKLLEQNHLGSGAARNLGALRAKGDILVFVDADMTFEPDFLEKLVDPIAKKDSKGTFTKDEYVANWDNIWARCWNFNAGIHDKRRIPQNFPDQAPVFRALLRSEFDKAGGFDNIGFTDDWTLSRKLGYQATVAHSAICYHKNPASPGEIYMQARWIGKNEFMTGTLFRQVKNLIQYSPMVSIFNSLILSAKCHESAMLVFKPIYDFGIWVSIGKSFLGEAKKR